jgi:hypothetical protein
LPLYINSFSLLLHKSQYGDSKSGIIYQDGDPLDPGAVGQIEKRETGRGREGGGRADELAVCEAVRIG